MYNVNASHIHKEIYTLRLSLDDAIMGMHYLLLLANQHFIYFSQQASKYMKIQLNMNSIKSKENYFKLKTNVIKSSYISTKKDM